MSLDDERVRFYFRHREQIEQWAALRSEAAAAVDEWMTQLGPDVEALAESLGADVRVRAHLGAEQAYPSFRLVRDGWGFGDAADPPACISLEWLRARTTMRGSSTPYVGLRSATTHAVGAALRGSDTFRQTRLARKGLTTRWWGAYSYVPPAGEFPASADSYRDALIDALRGAWTVYAPFVPTAGT